MIDSIKNFFVQFIEPDIASSQNRGHTLQVATAALLLEMMRMDNELNDAECQAIAKTLQTQFKLDTAQIETLMALAEQEAREANDYSFALVVLTLDFAAGNMAQVSNCTHVETFAPFIFAITPNQPAIRLCVTRV